MVHWAGWFWSWEAEGALGRLALTNLLVKVYRVHLAGWWRMWQWSGCAGYLLTDLNVFRRWPSRGHFSGLLLPRDLVDHRS